MADEKETQKANLQKLVYVLGKVRDMKKEAETVEENQEVKVYEPTPFEKEMMAVKTGNAIAPFFKNKGIIRHGKFKNRILRTGIQL